MRALHRIPISHKFATKTNVIQAGGDIEKARVFNLIRDFEGRLLGLRMVLDLKDLADTDFPHRDYLERYARELGETGETDNRIRYALGGISTSVHYRALEEFKKAKARAAKGGQQ